MLSKALGGFLAALIFIGIKALISKSRGSQDQTAQAAWRCPQCGFENKPSRGKCEK